MYTTNITGGWRVRNSGVTFSIIGRGRAKEREIGEGQI